MTAPGKGCITEVQRRLRAEQGAFAPKPVLPIIDEVVATVLSQHTSDTNSERAFAQLKDRFSGWEQVAAAPAGQVADAIRCGGIADQKARRIQQILAAISEREGRLDLGRLHDLDDAAARTYLESLPGVGPKTAACVLTFAMGRAAFPVDTHVHRVATRLGWLPAKTAADRAHRLLGPMVPAGIRYDLHVAMITHGRTVCRAQRPRCGACVLNDLCAYGRQDGSMATVRSGVPGHDDGMAFVRLRRGKLVDGPSGQRVWDNAAEGPYEVVCPGCGDDPSRDWSEISEELRRIRGIYGTKEGAEAALMDHIGMQTR